MRHEREAGPRSKMDLNADRYLGGETSAQTYPSGSTTNASVPQSYLEKATRSVSVIVPVLNEAETIRGFLRELRVRAPGAEIIVADGGSCDASREIAEPLCDRLVRAASAGHCR